MLNVILVEPEGGTLGPALEALGRLQVFSFTQPDRLLEHVLRCRPGVVAVDSSVTPLRSVRWLMSEQPLPIVVLASDPLIVEEGALQAGAVSTWPLPQNPRELEDLASHLELMSEVPVFRRPCKDPEASGPYRSVGLVASTGGPTSLAQILSHLDLPVPFLVVQHMAPESLPGFVQWLGERVPLPVKLAEHMERTEPGVYVAPAHVHLEWNGKCTVLTQAEPVSFQRPSGTVLLRSLARAGRSQTIGVVLTGLGEDGARGLLELRLGGGYTLVEAESTAVAVEMPAAAVRLNAAREIRPLEEIGPRLHELLSRLRV